RHQRLGLRRWSAKTGALHAQLPGNGRAHRTRVQMLPLDLAGADGILDQRVHLEDRKSTRLNSSHVKISYAVFCLKKKKTNKYYVIRNKKSPDVCQNFSTKNNFIW